MSLRSLLLCMGLALTPMAAMSQSAQDAIISQLTQQGFGNITVQTTLLGRVRILAVSTELRREIVFNPATGEILRDYWEPRNDRSSTPRPTLVNPRSSGSDDDDDGGTSASGGGTSSGSDDDDDDGGSTGTGSGTGSGGTSGGDDDDDDAPSGSGSGGSSGGSDDDDDDGDDDDRDDRRDRDNDDDDD